MAAIDISEEVFDWLKNKFVGYCDTYNFEIDYPKMCTHADLILKQQMIKENLKNETWVSD